MLISGNIFLIQDKETESTSTFSAKKLFQTRDKMGVSDTADTKLNTTHQNQISSIQIQIGDKTGKYLLKINKKTYVHTLRKSCFL